MEQAGFTLLELVVVIAIMGLVIGAITTALITTLQNEGTISDRVSASADAQITSSVFVRDVQSASEVTTLQTAGPVQGHAGVCGSGTTYLLGLYWNGTVVSYWTKDGTGGAHDLVRSFCGSTNESETISRGLPTIQGPATVTCGPNVSSCNYATTWMSTAGVSGISIAVVEPPTRPGASSSNGYGFSLSASPRYQTQASCGTGCVAGSPVPQLLLTGTGVTPGACPGGAALMLQSSGDNVTINGSIGFNANGDKVCNGNSNITLNVTGQIQEYGCGGSCSQVTSSLPAGACTCSAPTAMATQFTPPVVPPPTSPTSSSPMQTCTMAATVTCQPGYYPSGLTINSSNNVTFAPGNYLFGGALSIGGPVTFGRGDYTFDNGVTVSVAGVTINGTGAFFYMAGGSFNIATQNNSVNLVAPPTGTYTGILIYQPPANASPMALGAKGSSTVGYGGAIIAPSASVTLGSTGDDFLVGSLIAGSLSLGSKTATVTID